MTLPEAAHFGGAKRPVKERPLVLPLIDDRPMLKTITSRLHPPRPVVPYTTSNPVKSSSTLHVLTSANLVPCPHQPLAAWAVIKEQFTAFCLSLLQNETEADHARAKAEADIALGLPAEYRD